MVYQNVYKCPVCGSFRLAFTSVIGKESYKTVDPEGRETIKTYRNPTTARCQDCGEFILMEGEDSHAKTD